MIHRLNQTTSAVSSVSQNVEPNALPKIVVKARGGAPQIEAYVNGYIVGRRPALMNGNWARPLYYLSLVAMKGQGTTLQGIFARLVSTHSKDVSIEGIGDVVLAHHQSSVSTCGYTLHWNFEQAEVLPTRDIHAIIESNMLTMFDPVRGTGLARTSKVRSKQAQSGKQTKERLSLSTMKSSKAQNSIAEIRNRERSPLFLLMVPGQHQGDATLLEQLHFAFLDQRVPWPLDPSWASFLWARGLKQKEIEPLITWEYQPVVDDGEQEQTQRMPYRMFAEAYFCRPNPAQIQKDLQEALASRKVSTLLPPSIVTLPTLQHKPQEELLEVASTY